MIEPTAVAIAYLGQDPTIRELVLDNTAAQHRYGMPEGGWSIGDAGLVVFPVSGYEPDDAGMIRARLELRAYADQPDLALNVLRTALVICEAHAMGERTRTEVPLTDGSLALLYWLLADDSPQLDQDPDLQNTAGQRMDMARVTAKIAVAAEAVGG
jgi:hypothetical protein